MYWVPGHAEVRGNEMADWLAEDGSVQKSVRIEPSLGVFIQNIKKKIKCWVDNQHLEMWRGPSSTQRQSRKLILGPTLTTKARLLTFNRTQSRVVIGLLTGHTTLRRYLYLIGLNNNPHVGGVVQRKKLQSTFCVSVKLWFQRDMHM
jgi:hypothetical protein